MNDALLSVDSAWLCAAELDVEREEVERLDALARRHRRQICGKYELESTSAQLNLELKTFQLERRKKAAQVRREHSLAPREDANRGNRNQLASPPAAVSSTAGPFSSNRNSAVSKQKKHKTSVYAMENLRLAMLMRDKALQERVKKKKRRPRVVDDMLTLERRYAVSASRLQQWWRVCMQRAFWKSYFRKVQACVQIQRMARGMLCRGWVRMWHVNRTYRVTRIQAAFRGFYMRTKVIATWRQWEYVNATKIQSIVRGHFGRRRCARRRRFVAAQHIQMLWRGYASRKQSNLLWLAQKTVNLQRLIRGVLARKAVRKLQIKVNSAATQIQRMFRGMQTRVVVAILLRDRETRNRQELMRVLEVEEEWHRVQRDKVQKRLERLQLHREVCELEEQYYRSREKINDMESIYLDMQTQRLRVSPRAIEQGWVEEMEEKMKLQRATITQLKLDTVFKIGLEFKQKEQSLLEFQQRIHDLEEKRRKFEIWRKDEFLDYWERECLFQHKLKVEEKRKRVAEQRRKWTIKRYHSNGKPDKRWKCGRWGDDVLKQAKKKEVFCVANADLLAIIQSKWRKHLKGGKPESDDVEDTIQEVDDLANQMALVAAQAQIEQTGAIFDPVFQDIEKSYLQMQNQQRNHDKKREAVKTRELKLRSLLADEKKNINTKQTSESSGQKNKEGNSQNREQRKRQLIQAAKIPWQLLDQLAAERRKLEEEKAMFKVWRKSHAALTQRKPNDKPQRNGTLP